MAMTDAQVDLLRAVLEHITAHPEQWDQDWWATKTDCGTTYCVAGHAAVMSGYTIEWYDRWSTHTSYVQVSDGGRPIEYVAAEVLGIQPMAELRHEHDTNEAFGHLFHAGNTLTDLWRIAGELSDGRIVTPAGVS